MTTKARQILMWLLWNWQKLTDVLVLVRWKFRLNFANCTDVDTIHPSTMCCQIASEHKIVAPVEVGPEFLLRSSFTRPLIILADDDAASITHPEHIANAPTSANSIFLCYVLAFFGRPVSRHSAFNVHLPPTRCFFCIHLYIFS